MKVPRMHCDQPMIRERRDGSPFAEILFTCRDCGARTKVLAANSGRAGLPPQPLFPEPPRPGQWEP